jgi:hypothetical protein
MINKLSEFRTRYLLREATPEETIRMDEVLNQYLEPYEFDILIRQIKKELGQTNQEQLDNKPVVKESNNKRIKDKGISIKLDSELYDKIHRYLNKDGKGSRNKMSKLIRHILIKYLDEHLN